MTGSASSTSAPRDGNGQERPASPSERLLERLLTTLIASTEEASASWEADDAHDDLFCLVGQGWLVATRSIDGDGAAPYALVVAGPSGELVLEVASTSAFGRPLGHLFARLHAAAAATTTMSNANQLLTSIVAQLSRPSDGHDGTHAQERPATRSGPSR